MLFGKNNGELDIPDNTYIIRYYPNKDIYIFSSNIWRLSKSKGNRFAVKNMKTKSALSHLKA